MISLVAENGNFLLGTETIKEKEDLIVITNVSSRFGDRTVHVSANVYKDRPTLEKVSLKHLVVRNSPKVEKKEEA